MRWGIAGFVLGGIAAILGYVLVQHVLLTPVADEITYRFYTCVFSGTEFPEGDIDNGRAFRRALVPIRTRTTFYDASYHEVKSADRPGRYGAVVRITSGAGVESDRFITLYRTAGPIAWDAVAVPIFAQLPPELGFDPVVLRRQQGEIGRVLALPFKNEAGQIPTEVAILLAGLSETLPRDPPAFEHDDVLARDAEWWYGLRAHLGLTPIYHYLVDLPRGYSAGDGKSWPLILFLDHAGDTGDDLRVVRHSGLPGLIAQGKQLPAIVVSPQCPANDSWSTPVLSHLLDEIETKYRVDADRLYINGISAGGDEAWDFALAHPDRLAAIVPIAGESDPGDAARLANLPIWAFHGMKDPIVPVVQTIRVVDAVRQAGGHAHLTLFPDAGHAEAWNRAYAMDALYTWLLAQKRGQAEVKTPGVPNP